MDPRGARQVWISLGAGLAVATCAAAFTLPSHVDGTSELFAAAAPILLFVLGLCIWRARPWFPALCLFALVFVLDNPAENPAGGMWKPPLAPVAALLFENLNNVTGLGFLHFALLDAVVFLLLAVVIRRAARGGDHGFSVQTASCIALLSALAFAGVLCTEAWGLARGGDFRNSLWQVREIAYVPLFAFVFHGALRGPADHRILGWLLGVACWIKALTGLYFYDVICRPLNVRPQYVTTHSDSILFVMATVVALVMWLERKSLGTWLFALVTLPLAGIAMIINDRRLAWVELAGALVVVYAVFPWTAFKRFLARFALAMVPVAAIYFAAGWNSNASVFKPVQLVKSIVSSETNASTATRDIENYNLQITLKQNPMLGTGFGHEYQEASRADDISRVFAQYRFIPHNSLLGLWAFGGFLGFTLFWLPLVAALFLAKRSYLRAKHPQDRAAALAVAAAVVVYAIQAYGDMGIQSWEGAMLIGAALATVGKLAVAVGAWPVAGRAPATETTAPALAPNAPPLGLA